MFAKIEKIISEAKKGKLFILVDDENRENEGDLIFLASKTTPEKINFMARHGRGLICLALDKKKADQLGLQLMPSSNNSRLQTAFTISIEAKKGVTTGISASDRAKTILTAIKNNSTSKDIVTPGHIFPLVARKGGCLVRAGHTEASVDIAKLARSKSSSAVICEIMNDDGSMAKRDQLFKYAKKHKLSIATIEDLIAYRLKKESLVYLKEKKTFFYDNKKYFLNTFANKVDELQHLAIVKGVITKNITPKVRVISSNSIDVFLNKNTNEKINRTLNYFKKYNNCILLIMRESALSDLPSSFSSKSILKKNSNENRLRYYGIGVQILKQLNVKKMNLVSSSKKKLVALDGFGIKIVKQEIIK